MRTARDEAIARVDEPGFKGALARLILHRDSNPAQPLARCRVWLWARRLGPLCVTR
jgi:hypothetical protein